jgi:UDP-N-acetylglucosamine 3-dehydrogenase
MNPVRMGLIGAGVMGSNHARAVSAVGEARLAAVADLDETRARSLAAGFQATAYADYNEMLARESLEAVIVATSDPAHLDACVAAARAGAHILVEKPLATTLADCDAIAAAAEESGVRVLVGHTLRWEPRYVLAQEAIAKGEIGVVSYVFARRSNMTSVARRVGPGTNVARFLAIHDIDWVQWALGETASAVVARTSSRVLTDVGTPDAYFLLLRFPSGALACIEAAWLLQERGSCQRDFQLEVAGSKGMIYISVQDQGLRIDTAAGLRFADVTYSPVIRGAAHGVYVEEIRHFVEVIRSGAPPQCSMAEGRAAVAVVLAAEQSVASGGEVAVG